MARSNADIMGIPWSPNPMHPNQRAQGIPGWPGAPRPRRVPGSSPGPMPSGQVPVGAPGPVGVPSGQSGGSGVPMGRFPRPVSPRPNTGGF